MLKIILTLLLGTLLGVVASLAAYKAYYPDPVGGLSKKELKDTEIVPHHVEVYESEWKDVPQTDPFTDENISYVSKEIILGDTFFTAELLIGCQEIRIIPKLHPSLISADIKVRIGKSEPFIATAMIDEHKTPEQIDMEKFQEKVFGGNIDHKKSIYITGIADYDIVIRGHSAERIIGELAGANKLIMELDGNFRNQTGPILIRSQARGLSEQLHRLCE